MSLKPYDPWANEGPQFNRPVADVIYKTLIGMDPDEAQVFSTMLLGATLQNDLMVHEQEISKALGDVAAKRSAILKGQLSRTVIAKTRGGQDATPELAALVELNKALSLSGLLSAGGGNDHAARVRRAREQLRDLQSGQFKRDSTAIDHSNTEPIPDALASRYGIPRAAGFNEKLSPQQIAQFQNAYRDVSALIGPYQMMPRGSAFVHIVRAGDPNGRLYDIPGVKDKLPMDAFDPALGPIVAAHVSTLPPKDAAGATFDVLRAFGVAPGASAVGAGQLSHGVLSPQHVQAFGDEIRQPTDLNVPSENVFQRMRAGATLLRSALGPSAPPQAQMALSVAHHVGTFGPVAQKVIGPTADRAAYRYRGTEREPDPALRNAFHAVGERASKTSGSSAASTAMREAVVTRDRKLGMNMSVYNERTAEAYRTFEQAKQRHTGGRLDRRGLKVVARQTQSELDAAKLRLQRKNKLTESEFRTAFGEAKKDKELRAGSHAQLTADIAVTGFTGDDKLWHAGEVLDYFKHRVPKPELNSLQLASGVVPPSEGVIFDRKGRLAYQAVGYGDDHYLPFNLKNLRKLRGGEYVRTRTFGGPTTEDIYTGLITGARRLTVVSGSGVYTVTFDPTFHGGRRYNDKAARMVGRYGHLLDAVKSETVRAADVDPSMKDQLRAEAAALFPYSPKVAEVEYERLLAQQRNNPKLSTRQMQQVATTWLGETAVNTRTNGRELSPEDQIKELARAQADRHVAAQKLAYNSYRRTMQARAQAISEGIAPDTYAELPAPPMPESPETAFHAAMQLLDDPDPLKRATRIAELLGKKDSLESAMRAAEQDNRDAMQNMRLNGAGYASALTALHEQFPYYILKPKYNPWGTGFSPDDTGYVKPRFNRPAEAMAGYFDRTITGNAKVGADTIRGQNASVPRTAPASAGASGTPAAPATPEAAAEPRSPSTEAALRAHGERQMLAHLMSQENFAPGAAITIPDGSTMQLGGSIRGFIAEQHAAGVPVPDYLMAFYGPGRDDAKVGEDYARDPVLTRKRIDETLNWVQKAKAMPIPEETLAAYRGEVRQSQAADTRDLGAMLAAPNAEYKLAQHGDVYRGDLTFDTDTINTEYRRNPAISGLVQMDELPEDVDAPDFPDMSKALAAKLNAEYNVWAKWMTQSAGGTLGESPVNYEALNARALALVQANTLNRRYGRALEREQATQGATEAAAAATATTNVVENHMSPEEWIRYGRMSEAEKDEIRRAQSEYSGPRHSPGPPRAIGS